MVILLAMASGGCATGLVAAEKAVHRTLTVTTVSANAYCDAPPPSAEKAQRCVDFNRDLVPIVETAKSFNLAVQERSPAEVPAMIAALLRLRDITWELLPEGTREMLKARFDTVYAQVARLGGQP
jgi:hypothetical protein